MYKLTVDADEKCSWSDKKKMTGGVREMYGVCSMAKRVLLYGDALAAFPSSSEKENQFIADDV